MNRCLMFVVNTLLLGLMANDLQDLKHFLDSEIKLVERGLIVTLFACMHLSAVRCFGLVAFIGS